MVIPTYVLFLFARGKLKKSVIELRNRNVYNSLAFFSYHLRWYLVGVVFAFALSFALVVGTHRLFVGIEPTEKQLILHYPWPRSNVRLNWDEIAQSDVEIQRSRFRQMFRLK